MGRPRTGSAWQHGDHYDIRITLADGSRGVPICLHDVKVTNPDKERCPGYRIAQARALSYTQRAATEGASRQPKDTTKPKTIADVVAKWVPLVMADPKLSEATKKGHRGVANGPIVERFGKLRPERVGRAELRAWVRDLRSRLSPTRTRNIFWSLSKMFEDSAAEDWISIPNPCRDAKVQSELPEVVAPDNDDKAHHTEAEARRLLAGTTAPERKLRYAIAFTSGMRDGEIAGLRWCDVVAEKGFPVFRIRGALAREGDTGWATRRDTKTPAGRRLIPIHPDVLVMLKAWRDGGWRAHVGREPTEMDSLFTAEDGAPWRPRSAEYFRDDLKAAGLPTQFNGDDFEFRSTRRSFATWLEAHDVSGHAIDRLLGHSAKTVRQKHYSAGDLKVLAEAVATIDLSSEVPSEATTEHGGQSTEHRVTVATEALGRLAPPPVFKTGVGHPPVSWAGSIPVRFR